MIRLARDPFEQSMVDGGGCWFRTSNCRKRAAYRIAVDYLAAWLVVERTSKSCQIGNVHFDHHSHEAVTAILGELGRELYATESGPSIPSILRTQTASWIEL